MNSGTGYTAISLSPGTALLFAPGTYKKQKLKVFLLKCINSLHNTSGKGWLSETDICNKTETRDQWFWQNFINSMCDIKFWKDIENLRSVYKKLFHFERFLLFLTFFNSQKSSLSLLRDENFFSLNRSHGASKNPSFRTDFKNVHMTLVKSCTQKSFCQKNILEFENLPKS